MYPNRILRIVVSVLTLGIIGQTWPVHCTQVQYIQEAEFRQLVGSEQIAGNMLVTEQQPSDVACSIRYFF